MQNISEETIEQSIVPVSENLIRSNTNVAIEISVGEFRISVSGTAMPELLKMVLQVAAGRISSKDWFGNLTVICSYIKG